MATVREGNRAALVIGNIALAVTRARAEGTPVIWVQHGDEDLPIGSAQWQWVPELVPADGEFRVYKQFNSPFEQTPLEAELAVLGVTHIVLAGAASNWCIRATAHAAIERGYDLTLVSDAHTTESLEPGDGASIHAVDFSTPGGVRS